MISIREVSCARKPGHLVRGAIVLILVLASVGVVACADLRVSLPPSPTRTPFVVTVLPEGATELYFETLYESYTGGNPSIRNPAVTVVAGGDEISLLDTLLGPSLLNRLRPSLEGLDYGTYFVLVALRGHTGCGVPIEIKQIIRQGDTVHIYAYFPDFPRGQPCPPEATYPYHLVKVRKDGNWDGEFIFVLYDNDRPVAETKHFIP